MILALALAGCGGGSDEEAVVTDTTPATTAPAETETQAETETEAGQAAIVVEEPEPGAEVESPVTVAGNASVFEANVSLRIEGPGGEVLAEGFATAAEGAPGRGDFEAQLELDAPVDGPTEATLVAYEQSAATGEETHVVRVPITLVP